MGISTFSEYLLILTSGRGARRAPGRPRAHAVRPYRGGKYLLILTQRQVVSLRHVESWPACEAYRDFGPDASPLRPDRASDPVAPHRIGAPALRPRRRRAPAADRDAAAAR